MRGNDVRQATITSQGSGLSLRVVGGRDRDLLGTRGRPGEARRCFSRVCRCRILVTPRRADALERRRKIVVQLLLLLDALALALQAVELLPTAIILDALVVALRRAAG